MLNYLLTHANWADCFARFLAARFPEHFTRAFVSEVLRLGLSDCEDLGGLVFLECHDLVSHGGELNDTPWNGLCIGLASDWQGAPARDASRSSILDQRAFSPSPQPSTTVSEPVLRRLIDELSPDEALVLHLTVFEGRAPRDIAGTLGVSLATVYRRLNAARTRSYEARWLSAGAHWLVPSRLRLQRALRYVFDEDEFLSPFGLRSLSRVHKDHPYICTPCGTPQRVDYEPGEAATGLFGGNSNWRGPIWLPINYLFVEAMERYHHFYGDTLRVECPTGSGRLMNLREVARELTARLARCSAPTSRAAAPVTAGSPLDGRSPLARSHSLLRVFSRRHRPRARRQPSDGLDGAGHAAAQRLLHVEGFRRRLGRRPAPAGLKPPSWRRDAAGLGAWGGEVVEWPNGFATFPAELAIGFTQR